MQDTITQQYSINPNDRALLLKQKPIVLWFTGISGAGKSTISNLLDIKLYKKGFKTIILDGDNTRNGLCKDLGFTKEDRHENIRRIIHVTKLTYDAGLITIVSFISPYQIDRTKARNTFPKSSFIEIFIDTPFEIAEQRDPKGLYKKARNGYIENFTGIDSDYEIPVNPEIYIDTTLKSPDESSDYIINYLYNNKFI